jgi:hypothetical protein
MMNDIVSSSPSSSSSSSSSSPLACLDFFNRASQFYESIETFADSLTTNNSSSSSSSGGVSLQKTLFNLFNEDYEMALLCQLCYTPQHTKIWPVRLSKRKQQVDELCKKILPIARAGLTVAKGVNGIAGTLHTYVTLYTCTYICNIIYMYIHM